MVAMGNPKMRLRHSEGLGVALQAPHHPQRPRRPPMLGVVALLRATRAEQQVEAVAGARVVMLPVAMLELEEKAVVMLPLEVKMKVLLP